MIRTFVGKSNPYVFDLLEDQFTPGVFQVWITDKRNGSKYEFMVYGINWNNLFKKFTEVTRG